MTSLSHSLGRRRFIAGASAIGALSLTSARRTARAAGYPERNIKVVIPTAQGGGADRLARTFADTWRKGLGVPFEFDFFPGGSGQVVMKRAAATESGDPSTAIVTFASPGRCPMTIRTGQDACRTTAVETLPSSHPLNVPSPRAPTTIMSASMNVFGSNFPSECFLTSGKMRSFSSCPKCGNSHCSVNSARWWYHHHTESNRRFSSSCSSSSRAVRGTAGRRSGVVLSPDDEARAFAAQVASARKYVELTLKPQETYFDFTNRALLFYLLRRDNPIRYVEVANYESEARQREVIAALERNPHVRAALVPPGGEAVDGVPNDVRAPLVWQYLQQNFHPDFEEGEVVFWRRK